jgi:hypothetical protein
MLDYYETKLFSPSDEISELGNLKLLQSLDNWSYRIIGLGFPFLSITLTNHNYVILFLKNLHLNNKSK